MDKLRVALIGGYSIESGCIRGGVQAATAYLVKGLAKIDDLELHILTSKPKYWTGSDRIEQDRVIIHLLSPNSRFERLRRYPIYKSILIPKLHQIMPDVVHAHEAAADAYVTICSGIPTLVTAHGIRREDAKFCHSWGQRLRFYFDALMTERYVMRHTRYLIAISHYVTDYFSSVLRHDLKVYYIPNAIDMSYFNLNSAPSQPIVLFAGRVTRLKRVMDLVQAFASVMLQVPSAQLRIAGECSSDIPYVKSIREWVMQNGLEDHIHLLGELDQEVILHEFDQCSIFILSSAHENAPMVIAQAMASGKPVIATRVGGVAEMIGKNSERGLLVNVGDINGFSNALLKLLQDPVQRLNMGQAGHAFALENYHQDRVAQRTIEVYKQIVARESIARV